MSRAPRRPRAGDPAPRRAVVATRIFEPEGGAAPARLGRLVRALERRGYRTTVLTTRAPSGPPSTATVRRWPVLRDRSGMVRGYVQYASFDIPLALRLLARRRPDIVVAEPPPTTGFVVAAVCRVRRIPFVYFSADVTTSALEAVKVNPLVRRGVAWLERRVLRSATRVLAVSDGVRDEVVRFGADPGAVTVVGTGIDTDIYRPDGDTAASGAPFLIYAGTMSEIQGAEVFVEAFRRAAGTAPDARLVMFGGGVEMERLRQLAAPLGDRVQFPGLVPAEEVARWMRGAVAGLASVRPSRGYDFAYSTKALATAACGTPVIFAGSGPVGGLIREHRLGWALEWDADAVAAAMVEALGRGRVPLAPEQVQVIVDRHSLHAVAERSVDALDQVLAAREVAAGAD